MKVTIHDATSKAVQKIGASAAICYDGKTDPESNTKRARHCKASGHLSTMRFAYASINISGISRVASHQIVRIAHAGILQQSQRYVPLTNISYIEPAAVGQQPRWFRWFWRGFHAAGSLLYRTAIRRGIRKEDARYCLPQSCTTELNLCLNFQGWQTFLNLRTSKATQWEVREVALEIQRQFRELWPELF